MGPTSRPPERSPGDQQPGHGPGARSGPSDRALARYEALLATSRDVFAALSSDLTINWISAGVERLLGFPAADLIGIRLPALLTPDSVNALDQFLAGAAAPLDRAVIELDLRTQSRRTRLVEATISHTAASSPLDDALVMLFTDITDQRALEAGLRKQSLYDPLTGLFNRTSLHHQLDRQLQRLGPGRYVGLLHLDIDDFRTVNTSIGFERGDDLLAQVAARLRSGLRPGDVLARVGGNEFAIIVTGTDPKGIVTTARRVAALFDQPFDVADRPQRLRISMGIDVTNDRRVVARDVLDHAALALGAAKGNSQEPLRVYEAMMRVTATERFELGADLNGAAARGELHLVYQPIVDLASGDPRGVEALLRWHHPLRGPVSPGLFIPLAEKSGVIVEIGRWVMAEACGQLRAWDQTGGGPVTSAMGVSVNVSARQLELVGEAERLVEIVSASGLAPHRITVELTESTLLEDPRSIREQLSLFRDRGMRVAVDDFGTGAAGLSHLRDVPFNVVKIDKSYVDALDQSGEAVLLVQGVIELAHTLGALTVAEGVEQTAQLDLLASLGCDLVQGFALARPMEPGQFLEWLAAQPVAGETGGPPPR